MNCMEFRRQLLIDPNRESSELDEHKTQCQACTRFYFELQQQEKKLQVALATPVPDHLAERILLANHMGRSSLRRYVAVACLAASLAVLSIIWLRIDTPATTSWSEIALAHTLNELDTLQSNRAFSDQQLDQALSRFHLSLEKTMGKILYLDNCDMPGGKGLHIVIDTEKQGLVTLILPPPGSRASRDTANRDGFFSNLLFIGSTPVGIVTDNPEALSILSGKIGSSLRSQV